MWGVPEDIYLALKAGYDAARIPVRGGRRLIGGGLAAKAARLARVPAAFAILAAEKRPAAAEAREEVRASERSEHALAGTKKPRRTCSLRCTSSQMPPRVRRWRRQAASTA